MCLMFHVRVVHFLGILKKKIAQNICLLSQNYFFTGSINLGAQMRCTQNRYAAVQTDLRGDGYIKGVSNLCIMVLASHYLSLVLIFIHIFLFLHYIWNFLQLLVLLLLFNSTAN